MEYDVVIVGGGLAGLTAALHLEDLRVAVVTKTGFAHGGSSNLAQGGVAVALGADDSPELHAKDTVEVGGGLNDSEAVRLLTSEGPTRVKELIAAGAAFDRLPDGQLQLGREAAHSRRRIVHAADATGAEMVRALSQAVKNHPNIDIHEHVFALDLVVEDNQVKGLQTTAGLFKTGAVVLATGGCGRVYRYTTNPVAATGDGLAMAARAGARLSDLEFVQFHPTALDTDRDPLPLLTEALRGDGALLLNERGHRFTDELAPRDVVARAIWFQKGRTFLDLRPIKDLQRKFPGAYHVCQGATVVPVTPAAHYHMGGVAVDPQGRTTVDGLWACGEVAATGVHGANRLASNSLLEALVFGARVAADIAATLPPVPETGTEAVTTRIESPQLQAQLRQLMWDKVGLVRNQTRLEEAQEWLEAQPCLPGETGNLLTTAELITRAALERPESRGAHYRDDRPETAPDWQRHLVFQGLKRVS